VSGADDVFDPSPGIVVFAEGRVDIVVVGGVAGGARGFASLPSTT
jgi:hypothetical protein